MVFEIKGKRCRHKISAFFSFSSSSNPSSICTAYSGNSKSPSSLLSFLPAGQMLQSAALRSLLQRVAFSSLADS